MRHSALILSISTVLIVQGCATPGWYDVRLPDGRTERIEYDLKQCQMVDWKKNYRLDASLNILNKYKGSGGFGFSAEESRLLDTLQTDLGLKFEANCKTYLITGRNDDALFKCEVSKLGSALDQLRALNAILETVKSDRDATAKRDVVLQALRVYGEVLGKDCSKGLSLSKDTLKIVSQTAYEDTFSVLNGSAVRISWFCKNMPLGFVVKEAKCKGTLPPDGISDDIMIVRKPTFGEPYKDYEEYYFSIEASNGESKPLKVETDNLFRNVQLPRGLKSEAAVKQAKAAVLNLHVQAEYPFFDWIVGTVLYNSRYYIEAKQIFGKIAQVNPTVADDPTFSYNMALVHFQVGDMEKGYEYTTKLTSKEGYEDNRSLIASELLRTYQVDVGEYAASPPPTAPTVPAGSSPEYIQTPKYMLDLMKRREGK